VTRLNESCVHGSGANLQTAIDQATGGTRLQVQGLCVGTFLVGKNISLIGSPTAAFPSATLDGDDAGTVLEVPAGIVVIRYLTITNGDADFGGGIINRDTVRLQGRSTVSGNVADDGCWRRRGHE
jgi:nitrous oxidase accessory protein NosD